MLCSRFVVRENGKTAYEEQKGRKCKIEVVPLGEKVFYKQLKDSGEKKNILASNFEEGVWLGHSRQSNEVLIGTREGVVRAWATKRMAAEDMWDGKLIKEMKGTPQKPDPNGPEVEIPIKVKMPLEDSGLMHEEMLPSRGEQQDDVHEEGGLSQARVLGAL